MKTQGALAFAFAATAAAFQTGSKAPVNNVLNMAEEGAAAPAPMEMSKSMPFLAAPKNTAGMIGDKGFDPFGFSDTFDIKWMREAELKHGRVSMLAVVGFLVSQAVHLPGPAYQSTNPIEALSMVGPQPLAQIFLFCGFLEFTQNKGKMTMLDMFEDKERKPGFLGFDPMNLGKGGPSEEMQLKELENGRLAMCAIGGLVHHFLLFGHN
ncbi:unnamed protein product [Heterosigma akashiwo]|mmetsp:Transcript_40947/g.92329  ORF Transcript_40947/g.92329 Transcript_40947/m.92329 type:complete len:209 (-) Transcript_40947:199-825(-)